MRTAGRALALALLALASLSPAARADDQTAALRGQLEQIKSLVADFEARLRALEAARGGSPAAGSGGSAAVAMPVASPVAPAAAAPSVAPAATTAAAAAGTAAVARSAEAMPPAGGGSMPSREAWRRVREGLKADDVTALIGAPSRTFDLAGKTVWYYYYPEAGAGSVFFSSSGAVSSVQRPARAGW